MQEAMLLLRHALPGVSAPSGATAGNVVLNYVPGSFGTFAGLPAEVEWVHPGHGDSVHALRLQVHDFPGAGRYVLHFDFNDGALEPRLRRRSLRHFERLLDAVVEEPDRSIASLDVLVDDEHQALAALNATGAVPLPQQSVTAMFEARAARDPDAVAVRQGENVADVCGAAGAGRRARGHVAGARARTWRPRRDRRPPVPALGHRHSRHVAGHARRTSRSAISAPPARLEYVLQDSGARMLLAGRARSPYVPGRGCGALRRRGDHRHRQRGRTGPDRPWTTSRT